MEEQASGSVGEVSSSAPTVTSPVTPAPVAQATSDNPGTTVVPASSASVPAQEIVGGLDLTKLPEEHRQGVREWAEKREKDQLRYLTKKSEEYQVASKKAQYYDEYVGSPEYAAFRQWIQNRNQQPVSEQAKPADAREFTALGYSEEESARLAEIVDRRLEAKINQRLTEKEQQWTSRFNQEFATTQQVKSRQELDSLAQMHPDVYELINAGVFKMAASEFIAAGQNPTVEQIYAKAKDIESFYLDKARQKHKVDVQTKKDAVTATPTTSGDVQIVYVDNPKQINEAAARYASQGKKVRIMLKPRA